MNLGTFYPKCNRPDVTDIMFGDSPPRKWRYHSNADGSTLGTLAPPWLGIDFLSETYELSADGQWLEWKLNHPTVADNYIKVRWSLQEQPSGTPRMRIWTIFEWWYQGSKYGDFELTKTTVGGTFLGATGQWTQNISWNNLLDAALFRSINTSRYCACLWGQDADYQPYHTNPF